MVRQRLALRAVTTLGYSLVPDYADPWGAGNETTVRSNFEVKYRAGGIGVRLAVLPTTSLRVPFLQNGLGNAP